MTKTLTIRVDFPQGAFLQALGEGKLSVVADAATAAMKDVSDKAKRLGRTNIGAAGFGAKWQNALRANVYPAGKASISPAAFIYHKIPYAGVFDKPTSIAGQPLLWLPLPTAFAYSKGKRPTPKNVAAALGAKPFVSLTSARGAPLLGARIPSPSGKGTITVPLFHGVDRVQEVKAFNIRAAALQAADGFEAAYRRHFKDR